MAGNCAGDSKHTSRVVMNKLNAWPIADREHYDALAQVLNSGKWHYGGVSRALEEVFEAELGRPAVAVSSCAWAIYLALRAMGPFSTVAVPAYTYHGTVHPVVWAGASPVFVDVDPSTFTICAEDLARTLKHTAVDAVIGVHVHGMPFDQDIAGLCRAAGVPLIEDACQAQGATLNDAKVGAIGDAAAFSFNARKTVPAGLGGLVTFSSDRHAERARALRDYGARNENGLLVECGSYLPMGEFDAALVLVQLKKLPGWLQHADHLAARLGTALEARAPHVPNGRTHTWHKYRIRGTHQDERALSGRGVRTSRWVTTPLPALPAYKDFVSHGRFPGAEDVCSQTFCLFDDEYPLVAQSETLIGIYAKTLQEHFS